MSTQPLFDTIFTQGESSKPSSLVKRRAIETQFTSPARRTDPDTSHEAANAHPEIRGQQKVAVYLYLVKCGANAANDYEGERDTGILRTSFGKRRLELMEDGLVEYAGFKRPTDTKCMGRCHRVK